MPEIIDRRISFNAGEMSPWLDPRIDLEKYRMGCRQMENMRPSIYGGALRRVGTEYIGVAANAASKTRLIPFIVNAGTNYILEFSNLKLRVWQAGDTPVLVNAAAVPMEVVTPFLEAELDAIQFAQQNDVMFLVHPNHPPVYLARYNDSTTAGNWTLFPISISWPATLGPNAGTVTVQALATATSLFEPAAWSSASNYAALVTVKHDSKYWRWLAASTSTAPKTPGAEGSEDYWLQVAWQRDTTVYKATEPALWSAGTNYATATPVKFGGFYYNWLQASTTAAPKEPGAAGSEAYWLVGTWYANATAGTSPSINQEPAAWNAGLIYLTVGTKVKHAGKYWTLLLAGGIGIEPGVHEWTLRYWMRTNWAAGTPSDTLALGQGWLVPLVASADLFAAGHVGARWLISHRRETIMRSMLNANVATGAVTQPLFVVGEWTATISSSVAQGTAFSLKVIIERSYDLISWETHNAIASNGANVNQLLTGNEPDPLFLRLRVIEFTGSLAGSFSIDLEAGNPDATGMVEILSVSNARSAMGLVKFQLDDVAPTTRWEEPAWCVKNGHPRAVTLHEARLYFGGTTKKPTTVWGSAVDGYGDFRVASDADRAVSYTLASDESSAIEWLVSQDQLVIGTTSGEWVLGQRPGDDVPKLRRNTSFGSAPIQARAISDALVFVQRSRRKLREFAWSFERDGYLANDLTMLAEHMGDARILQIAIQRNPEATVWLVTERGDLLTLTYERGQNVAGWARQTTQGLFESVAVVNGSGEDDHIWVAVKRNIENEDVRYVERFRPDVLRDMKDGEQKELVYVDCAIIKAVDPQFIKLTTEVDASVTVLEYAGQYNGQACWSNRGVTWDDANTVETGGRFVYASEADGNGVFEWRFAFYPLWLGGGSSRSSTIAPKPWTVVETEGVIRQMAELIGTGMTQTITGLYPLAGKTCQVLTDGYVHNEVVAAFGDLELDWSAETVVVGLGYDSTLEPTYLETSDPGSVSKGGKKRLHRAVVELWKSNSGVEVSADGGLNYQALDFSNPNAPGIPGELFTGPKEIYLEGGTDRQASVILRQTQPLPFNLMGLTLRYQVEM